MKEASSLVDNLQLLLRYIVSGFICIMIAIYLDDSTRFICYRFLAKEYVIIVGIAVTLGIFTYSIHQAVFDKLMYSIGILLFRIFHRLPEGIKEQSRAYRRLSVRKIPGKWSQFNNSTINLKFSLLTQNYLRKESGDPHVAKYQAQLDKKLDLLNFMYCTAWAILSLSIFFYFKHNYAYNGAVTKGTIYHEMRIKYAMFGGLIVWMSAMILDYRIIKREMWMNHLFYQPGLPLILTTIKFPIAVSNEKVFITGNFNGWDTPGIEMMKDECSDVWTYSFYTHPGMLEYKLLDSKKKTIALSKPELKLIIDQFDSGTDTFSRNIELPVVVKPESGMHLLNKKPLD